MCSVPRSKLANLSRQKPPEDWPKSPFYNGEKRLTGYHAADTRERTRATAAENSVGTVIAIKDRGYRCYDNRPADWTDNAREDQREGP